MDFFYDAFFKFCEIVVMLIVAIPAIGLLFFEIAIVVDNVKIALEVRKERQLNDEESADRDRC